MLVAAIVLFLSGVGRYRKQVPIGSPFTVMAQVLVAAVRKWRVDPTHHQERVVLGLGPGLGVESQSSDAKQLAACTEKYRYVSIPTKKLVVFYGQNEHLISYLISLNYIINIEYSNTRDMTSESFLP